METQRNINIRLDGREIRLKVDSEDEEELLRRAAEVGSDKISRMRKRYTGRSDAEILSYVVLNVVKDNVAMKKMLYNNAQGISVEAERLNKRLEEYLSNLP